jgi:hypothetical protein
MRFNILSEARGWGQLSVDSLSRHLSAPGQARRIRSPSSFATWLFLVAVFLPAGMTVSIADFKFTPGRIAIILLLLPAVFLLFRRTRRFTASDVCVVAASVWMVGAQVWAARYDSISSSMAVALEFAGAYIVSRAYFFGRPALHCFVQVLKVLATLIIACAALEYLSSDYLITNSVAAIWGAPPAEADFRNGLLRARSTFPHAILYGTFCATAGAIFLYSEFKTSSRIFYVGLCFAGCIMAVSSAPLISFSIGASVYLYDCVLSRHPWRWKVLVVLVSGILAAVLLTANAPISWIIAHLTLDPSTGYFRKGTWDRALYNIDLSPITGFGFGSFGDPTELFDYVTVDSVWLVLALRFGIPVVIFLLLAIIMSFVPAGTQGRAQPDDAYLNKMGTAFTLVLVLLVLAGLTVHFWLGIWIFWAICIAIRVNLREQHLSSAYPLSAKRQWTRVAPSSLSLRQGLAQFKAR